MDYKPRMGRGPGAELTYEDFKRLYSSDVFYTWFGLDNPLMYTAHRAAGGMTSIYRQIGIGCEALFRTILQDELGLSKEDSTWSYTIQGANEKPRRLSLDGRIPLDAVADPEKQKKIKNWIAGAAGELDVDASVAGALKGIVFEIRQGYKSKDSKRQNADIANASTAYSQAYLPCAALMSEQIDSDIVLRYRNSRWTILIGKVRGATPYNSTYSFMKEIIGYDLADFFDRSAGDLRREVSMILETLLSAERA